MMDLNVVLVLLTIIVAILSLVIVALLAILIVVLMKVRKAAANVDKLANNLASATTWLVPGKIFSEASRAFKNRR
ncbi:hypothetical protein FJZ39_04405 [Candidatus Saccharibacteria bacterium]|nr:hypothetical protein [Candidatus Saccharibacteria bacterium]